MAMARRAALDDVNPVIWVKVDSIVLPHDRSRREPDPVVVERIARSFTDVGLLMPIGVTPHNVLIFGTTRLAAAKKLGWERIEAREFESADDPEVRRLMEWEENDARQDLTLEEQLAFKRDVLDPILTARAKERQQANGTARASQMWGRSVEGGNFPPSTERHVVAPVVTPAILAAGPAVEVESRPASGKSRDLLNHYLGVSGRTMEKFEQLADWSEDESLPAPVREEAARARDRANTLGKVDGEYKRVRALVEQPAVPRPDPSIEVEARLTRGFSAFERLLEEHPAAEVAGVLSEGGWRGLAVVLQRTMEWGRDARRRREACERPRGS
ncbi:ParB N-terminal domain-containing protein [Agromyces mariniharenae]|nr:ParB N-terminal domain-containing protein [Agromyces mariniharenae]